MGPQCTMIYQWMAYWIESETEGENSVDLLDLIFFFIFIIVSCVLCMIMCLIGRVAFLAITWTTILVPDL